jgi:hypothetical protein
VIEKVFPVSRWSSNGMLIAGVEAYQEEFGHAGMLIAI